MVRLTALFLKEGRFLFLFFVGLELRKVKTVGLMGCFLRRDSYIITRSTGRNFGFTFIYITNFIIAQIDVEFFELLYGSLFIATSIICND